MDYRDYIPTSKTISNALIILCLLALGILGLCCSCKTNTVTDYVRDTLIVVTHDTIKEVRYVKDTAAINTYKSIVERLEKETTELHTLILSEKGDTIKEYFNTIVKVNNSSDSVNTTETYKAVMDSVGRYQAYIEKVLKAMQNKETIKEEPSWFDKLKSNIFYMVFGVVLLFLTLFGIKKFILKK